MTRSVLALFAVSLWAAPADAAGPPGPLDAVPRQTSFAGKLEENGVGTTRSALPVQVNLYGADGGVQWTRSVNVPVNKGRFSVELGDVPPLPAALLNGPTAEVELSVGIPLVKLPRQRVLSAPFAHRSGDVIVDDRTLTIGTGGQFPGLTEAWAWLKTRDVKGTVTLQLANGAYNLPPGGLALEHPDGLRIKIIGNLSNASLVVLNATTHGFIIDNGSTLAQLAGFRLVGPGAGFTGIRVDGNSRLELGPAVVITGFDVGVGANLHSNVSFSGVQVTGQGISTGAGISVSNGALLWGTGATLSNFQLGVAVSGGAWVQLDAPSISSVRDGVNVTQGGFAELTGAAQISNAQLGLYAFGNSTIIAPPGITFTSVTTPRSPLLNTADTSSAWITE